MPHAGVTSELTGGCQCGAVRFRVGRIGRGSICHCRMCQKAFGAFYAPLISSFEVTWTRGAPSYFQSSNKVQRGFCSACGTPLTYEVIGRHTSDETEIAIGAFDNPELVAPSIQVNPADKLSFTDHLPQLPTRAVDAEQAAFNADVVTYQHPDHETTDWPEKHHG